MHRLILGITDESIFVDHIVHPPRNQHKVDNRKTNLRIVNSSQNCANSSKFKNNTSGTTGVYWIKRRQKWRAEISFNGEKVTIGYFDNKNDAIQARLEA